ncbi:hypothetical protein [Mucilaginibacter ginkgonis]|uniref:Uncharacterized protein n=1 Tax=Mucilaginibacter ginkgonis TaxID=2682091 RepID=A0A6I4I0S7_9SPHI|nr:hypothetical protein [Mucilaginibacter ginkgonis]QQL51087.1 hypothetical protein GO620_006455 [Mucilaginibacter ginkgonis]
MATSKQPTKAAKAAKLTSKTTPTLSPESNLALHAEQAAASPAQSKKVQKSHIKYVTSFNLKRTHIAGAVKANMFLSQDDYARLGVTGMQLGVTWDEIVRGCIDMAFASSDPLSALKNFVPAIQ